MTAVLQIVSKCCGVQRLPTLPGRLLTLCQKFSPCQQEYNYSMSASLHVGMMKPRPGNNTFPQTSGQFLQPATSAMIQTRGRAEIYYQPSAWKRVNKHGIHHRLQSQGGIEVIWRRLLKGRHSLAPYERLLTLPTYNGQILPDHHLKINQHLVNKDLLKHFPKGVSRRYKSTRDLRKKH